MDHAAVIRRARDIVRGAGYSDDFELPNFLDFSNLVRDIMLEWPKAELESPQSREFALGLRRLRDDLLVIVERDPMVLYKPAHRAALEFHQSLAHIRYFRAPNRTSKTQSGVADNYWVLTGQHPYRPRPPLPCSVGIVALNFSKLGSAVYIPKYVTGEGGNPLSPAFPETGKWFKKWDSKRYILHLACPECAEEGRAQRCKHPGSTLYLFSDVEGPSVFQGGQHGQIQFDEQISEEFFAEALKRLETVPHAGLIVTETPLGGKGFWTHKVLTAAARSGQKMPASDREMVSLHTCSQYDAGLTSAELIDTSRALMSEQEAEARVFGRPAAFSATAVFDNMQVSSMIEAVADPERVNLKMVLRGRTEGEADIIERADGQNTETMLQLVGNTMRLPFIEPVTNPEAPLRVWELPKKGAQYIIGADVAQGLTGGDASCAQVMRMDRRGLDIHLEHVASYHGWVNSLTYASPLFKLGLWYNCALLIPERRGTGDATIQRLKELLCWFLFRDTADPALAIFAQDSRFGIDTNVKTKAVIVSALQKMIWDRVTQTRRFNTRDIDTLEELGTYGQKRTPSGKSISFEGESGNPDDRVMGAAIAAYVAVSYPVYSMDIEKKAREEQAIVAGGLTQDERDLWAGVRRENQMEQHNVGYSNG